MWGSNDRLFSVVSAQNRSLFKSKRSLESKDTVVIQRLGIIAVKLGAFCAKIMGTNYAEFIGKSPNSEVIQNK